MITMHQRPDEATRTKDKSCRWIATCEIDGQHFEAQARLDAPMALARMMVDAGIDDDAVILFAAGVKGHMTYRSLHRMAKLTIKESITKPVGTTNWTPPPEWAEFRPGNAENRVEAVSRALPCAIAF